MKNEATINKGELSQIRDLLSSALSRIDTLLADIGCSHANAFNVTTMGPGNRAKYLCPDCGETIEEEIKYG